MSHTDDHIVEQRAGQAVEGAVFLGIVGTGDMNDACFDVDLHLGNEVTLKSALGTLDGDVVVLADGNFNACGDGDGCSTYS